MMPEFTSSSDRHSAPAPALVGAAFPDVAAVLPPSGVTRPALTAETRHDLLLARDARQDALLTRGPWVYVHELKLGHVLVDSWMDIAPVARADRRANNPRRTIWLLAQMAALQEERGSQLEDAASWQRLWYDLVPGPWGRYSGTVDDLSPMTIQVLTAAAVKFGCPYPATPAPYVSAINKAAGVFLGCLLPVFATPGMNQDTLLPPAALPSVRSWLLDTLEHVDYPYADDLCAAPRPDRSHVQRRALYVVGRPGEAPPRLPELGDSPPSDPLPSFPRRVPREELAWALDNAVASRLKQWARVPPLRLDDSRSIQIFQERLLGWPEAASALARTRGLLDQWPNPGLMFQRGEVIEPATISELLAAMTSVKGWPGLVQGTGGASESDLKAWLLRPSDDGSAVGDVRRLLAGADPAARDLFIRRVGPLIGDRPLAGGQGKNLAHLLLTTHPQAGVIRLLMRAVGPSLFSARDDVGRTPMDLARATLVERKKQSAWPRGTVEPQMAILERALLRSVPPPRKTRRTPSAQPVSASGSRSRKM